MLQLHLSVDEVLSTTRAVRRRLDLTRPVEAEVLAECVALAQQAPNGGNLQRTHFIVVTDPDRRAALADLWRQGNREFNPDPERARPLR
jgi:nitroreductase